MKNNSVCITLCILLILFSANAFAINAIDFGTQFGISYINGFENYFENYRTSISLPVSYPDAISSKPSLFINLYPTDQLSLKPEFGLGSAFSSNISIYGGFELSYLFLGYKKNTTYIWWGLFSACFIFT